MGGLGVNVKLQRVLVLLLVVSEGWLLGNSELVCEDRLLSVCNESCFCNGQSEGAGRVVSGEANATDGEPEPDVALAFGLVTAAGLSTALGASLVFCEYTVKQEQFLVLGAALGFSGGVMLYVSFVEIFVKSKDAFAACNKLEVDPCLWEDEDDSAAYVMATVCLFCGVILTLLIDKAVVWLSRRGGSHGHSHEHHHYEDSNPLSSDEVVEVIRPTITPLEDADELALDNEEKEETADGVEVEKSESKDAKFEQAAASEALKKKKLEHMGIMTALAIGLHNFPEGLATFVATLSDPAVGIALAVAIAIHNIPEGLCVAIPLYYSTGSRWRGFCFALLSGVTEIFGALLGYLFLMTVLGDVAYGVLFGVVSGMMVTIVIKELLPTAHRYDVHDKYVTMSFFGGALVMALSLVLFVV